MQLLGRRLSHLLQAIWQGNVAFFVVLLTVGLFGLIVVPSTWGLGVLSKTATAEEFLRTLWQVEAAALALSLAVILFLFQAIASSRPGGDLREFAEDSHLLKFLDVGVVALLLVGVTLLGIGSPNSGPWAATWATVWAGTAVLSLSVLFRLALDAVSESRLHARRLSRLRESARQSVEADVVARHAHKLLEGFCNSEQIELEPLFSHPAHDSIRLTSAKIGTVSDINLAVLRELSDQAKKAGGSLALSTYLGESVGLGHLLAYGPSSLATDPRRTLKKIFRFSPRQSDDLIDALEQVHTESLRAIRVGDPSSFERTAATYLEVTAAFSQAWARHPHLLPDPLAGFRIIEDPIRRLMRNLYEELHLVIRTDSREIMFEATSLPTSISTIGINTGVLDLSREGLRLSIELYRLAAAATGTEVANLALERSWTLLLEHAEYRIAFAIGREDSQAAERIALLPFARLSFNFIAELLRMMIENRDLDAIRIVDSRWSDFLEHWTPEYSHPNDWDVRRLQDEHGSDDPRTLEAATHAEENRKLAEEKKALFESRSQLRFGLAFWSLHRLLQANDKPPIAGILRHFLSHFTSLSDVVAITHAILDAEWKGGFNQVWSHWLLEDMPPGEAHFVTTDSRLMQTFLLASLMKINPDADPPGIQPYEWIRLRLQDLLALLDSLVADTALWDALPEVPNLSTRKEKLAQSLASAAKAQQHIEDEQVRSIETDPNKVSALERFIRKGVSDHQWVPALFDREGCLSPPTSEGPPEEKWFGSTQWIPKEMLLADSRFVGNDMFGEDIGRVIADGEAEFLIKAFADSPRLDIGGGSSKEKLETAIKTMRAERLRPSLIFIPLDWRLDNELALVSPFGSPEVPGWVPRPARNAFQGTVEGVPVFSWHSVPKNQIQIADLTEFGTWKQWRINPQGETVKIEILDHSEEDALELTKKRDKLFARAEIQTPEDRAAELRKHLFLTVHERFSLDISNAAAARWIEIAPGSDDD